MKQIFHCCLRCIKEQPGSGTEFTIFTKILERGTRIENLDHYEGESFLYTFVNFLCFLELFKRLCLCYVKQNQNILNNQGIFFFELQYV